MLHVAAKLALAPLLYRQAKHLHATALELPEAAGPRMGIVGNGSHSVRVLITGDSCAASVGAPTQNEGLAGHLARTLSVSLDDATIHWQLVARTGNTSLQTLQMLQEHPLEPADYAVLVTGVNDITKEVPFSAALLHRGQIAQHLRDKAGIRKMYIPALPPMEQFPALTNPLAWYAGALSDRSNRLQARWARHQSITDHVFMDGVMDASLMAEDGFHPAPPLYARVAKRLAERISYHCNHYDNHQQHLNGDAS
jgi:lysophospholipase L1-like esterase